MATLKGEIAGKGAYGIDAPKVIRNLLTIGIILAAVGVVVLRFGGIIGMIAAILLLLGGIVCLAEGVLMIWSSKKGKAYVVKALIGKLNVQETDRVLDVGCGRGFLLHSLAKQVPHGKATGIDIWNAEDQSGNHPTVTLRNAEAEGVTERVEILQADARQLPFEDGTFDIVASSLAIHNISHPAERQKAIAEIVRVLKPEGKVALLDFQHTGEYAQVMIQSGLEQVQISKWHFAMFPPVRIVTGVKK